MILPIITVPNPLLREKSKPVEQVDKKTRQFIGDLLETLVKKINPQGVGLSAVQVGKLDRIFAVNLPPIFNLESGEKNSPASEINVFINPEIIDASDAMTLGPEKRNPIPEGCLSIPSLYGPVPRHVWVKVRYKSLKYKVESKKLDRNNLDFSLSTFDLVEKVDTFSNFYGRVVQHEYDHLEGVLFTDYTLKLHEEIYFDQNDTLVPVPQPDKLITW